MDNANAPKTSNNFYCFYNKSCYYKDKLDF